MQTKLLNELLHEIVSVPSEANTVISGMSLDSRSIIENNLFFALPGKQYDGRQFIDATIAQGAAAIIAEDKTLSTATIEYRYHNNKKVPVFSIPHIFSHISKIAARFYDHPSKDMIIIGVTGTNGKTSCCHFLAQALKMCDQKVGILGTLGNGIYGEHKAGTLTTPNAIDLQRLLAEMKNADVRYVAMEASSQGITEGRTSNVDFDIAIFTNLTRDHLDYHGNMAAYGQAKRKLFQQQGLKKAIFNIDDNFGRELLEEFYPLLNAYGYSAEGRLCERHVPLTRAHQVHLNLEGLTASIHSPWGDGLLHTSLHGRFNLGNLLAVLTTLSILEFPLEKTLAILAKIRGVSGRMQLYGGGNKPFVVVDYAHTPEALRHVLQALREYTEGDLWCVFGCGGDRDQGKRPLMGQIAENIADHVIVTDDNPRHEDPQAIMADILQGMMRPEFAVIEHDRRRAIIHGISCARPKDIVLIAGKGHETYQQYGDEKRPFNDELEVQMILTEY